MNQPRSAANVSGLRNASVTDQDEREGRIQIQGQPSVHSIAQAVVIKDRDLFFLCNPDGEVPAGRAHGLGLYYHDCRFLDEYTLRVAGASFEPLAATAERGFQAIIQLSNPEIRMPDGGVLRKQVIGVKWKRTLDGNAGALYDLFTFQSFAAEPVQLPLALTYGTAFEPIFVVRGMPTDRRGTPYPPSWQGDALHFSYEGLDHLHRSVDVHFSRSPTHKHGTTASFEIAIAPHTEELLLVSVLVHEARQTIKPPFRRQHTPDLSRLEATSQVRAERMLGGQTAIESDSPLLNGLVHRSLRDLCALETRIDDRRFFAAGVPWFVALFGRDSVIAALQTLAVSPQVAAGTLRLLAHHQGQRVDHWRDEEPGKILHELRVGELARINAVPQTPYYGSIDATPLFLILLGRYSAWTGDLALFEELRSSVHAALQWMSRDGDHNQDGYLEYRRVSSRGLANQGWKDSGDAISNDDGTLATPPISLVEVQGYSYLAKRLIADLYKRSGDDAEGERLLREADALCARFNQDFWVEDKQFYALALQDEGRAATVITSNPGHALWTGIIDPARSARVVERLMADDMFNGWGVRTLSVRERRYNPVGYHIGTVWPHDNAFLVAGFRRYGFDTAACRLFTGMVDAATHFEHQRLPEAFAGFSRLEYEIPVRYPVACHPQAWAAGSIPFELEALLGLRPNAFARQLRIVRPVLPSFVDRLTIERLRVGGACIDLCFTRTTHDRIDVDVTKQDAELEVLIER